MHRGTTLFQTPNEEGTRTCGTGYFIAFITESYPVNTLFHEVQQHLNDGHVLPTILLRPGLSGNVDENVQARRGNVAQKINSMAAMRLTEEDRKTFKT